MLYKEIPYHHVYMYRKYQRVEKLKELRDFKIETYSVGMQEDWCQVQVQSGHVKDMQEAKDVFQKTFLEACLSLEERLFFLRHKSGEVVGSIALWEDLLQGKMVQRLHWLAIKDTYMKQGLANYLIGVVCAKCQKDMFLSTQTWSYPAIHLYLKHGFQPYNPYQEDDFEIAWRIIEDAFIK